MGESSATYQQVDEVMILTARIKGHHQRILAAAIEPIERAGKTRWDSLTKAKTADQHDAAEDQLNKDLVLLYLELLYSHTPAIGNGTEHDQQLVNDVLTAAWFICHGQPWGTCSITVRRATAVNFYVRTTSGNVSSDSPVSVTWAKANSPWSAQF